MSARELLEWRAYYELEPWGAERDNWHAAMLAHIMANAWRDSKHRAIPFAEFMYVDAETARKRKDLETLAWLDSLVSDDRPS